MNRKKILLPITLSLVVAFHLPAAAQIAGRAGVSAIPTGPGAAGPALNFALTPQQLQQRYQTATAQLDSALAGIAAIKPEDVTYANTVLAYEQATASWQREMYPIGFLTAVSVDPAQRQAAAELEDQMETYGVSLGHREDLYRQFERAAAKGEKLSALDARLLEDTVKSFRENGFALKSEEREKLKAMQERLGHLGNAFGRNIAESKDWLEVGAEGVKGLPEDFVSGLERTADGKYRIALNEASYGTYMRYAESAESRKSLLMKWQNRAADANLPILKEALGLRRDIAQLLGHKGYPEMTLKDRMAETPEKVMSFLSRLKDVVLSRARADLAEILEIKRRAEPDASQVFAWETGYLSRILRQERYDLDGEKVKEYFPVDRVVEGTMKVYQKTLGLSFREMKDGPRWHPDVRLIEISDAADGRLIGHFYLDLYPRDGKYTHAAAFTVIKGRRLEDGTYEKPASAMVANFPKAAPGKPALMPHSEVETFFHEFGHLMHQTLTKVPYASYSGSSVARDFVEAPSQMLENFVWERSVLDELSGHYKDGATLPDDLYKKMLAARSFQDGLGYAGQLGLGMADMVLHTVVPEDVSAVFNKVMQEFTGLAPVEGTNRVASFGHLMGGYSAGYYGYLWSKVYAQDIYTVFKAAGVVSPEVGARYRREILEVGSGRDEMESLRAFLGREPSEEAFMRDVRGEPETPAPAVGSIGGAGLTPAQNHSEWNLGLSRRKWWNPLTWFQGLGKPSSDMTKRFEALMTLACEGAARMRAARSQA
ncbi:MAG: hypothetical protein A2V88_14820 [Elusimicrobia bacterium RBG_16_66_12]|nr:MAG: hypothetical protein A2V88_14820 [Elusimicrobia bacterium RBG_16_66_12]